MAESPRSGVKILKLDHGNIDKNDNSSPPNPKTEGETSKICDHCKVDKSANENLISKLQTENEKLRAVIREFVETGRKPENVDCLLTAGPSGDYFAKNFDQNVQELSTAQKVLSTSVIFQQVISYFDDLTLLKIRPVCKFWAEHVTARLLLFKEPVVDKSWKTMSWSPKPGKVQVHLSYSKDEDTLGKNNVGSIRKLIDLMTKGHKTGQKFPCSNFHLSCPSLTTISDAVELLEKFGYLMESFTYCHQSSRTDHKITESALSSLLFKWAPNLKYVRFIWGLQTNAPLTILNGDTSLTLPNLQILDWRNNEGPNGFPIYREILSMSPNLRKILNDPAMEDVIQANQASAIKEILVVFGGSNPSTTSRLALQSQHCFQVEEIKIDYDWYDVCGRDINVFSCPEDWRTKVESLNTILQNNRHCLKKIQCQNLGPLAECGLDIPVMTNLRTLDIKTEFLSNLRNDPNLVAETFFRVFPKNLDVAKTFPKLVNFSWTIENRDRRTPGAVEYFLGLPVFETMGPLASVRSLTFSIGDKINAEFLRRIAVLLPHVKELTVDYNELGNFSFEVEAANNFPTILRTIWEVFQGVEEIHLLPYLSPNLKEVLLSDSTALLVDSAVTGLDEATVQQLAENCLKDVQVGGKSEDLADLQDKGSEVPSIRNMKSLRYLRISVQSENDFPIFTHVSGTHGFGLMSNLTVIIEAKGVKRSVIKDPKGLMSPNVKFYQLPGTQKPKW